MNDAESMRYIYGRSGSSSAGVAAMLGLVLDLPGSLVSGDDRT
jgi:hypothetical protein